MTDDRREAAVTACDAVALAGAIPRLIWNTALALAGAVAVVSVSAGAEITTAGLRSVAALLGTGLLGWGVGAILSIGEARLTGGDREAPEAGAIRASPAPAPRPGAQEDVAPDGRQQPAHNIESLGAD